MSLATASPPEFETCADVLEHLGDVPARRVRMKPFPGTGTVADVLSIYHREKRLCELVDGTLVEKAMGFYESRVAAFLIQILGTFCEQHDRGIVLAPDGLMEISPELVRIPDVSFISWDRLPNRELPAEPIPKLAPNLAVEVLSESNTPREMERKCGEYFAAGVELVWLLDPRKRSVAVHTSADSAAVVHEGDRLTGGDVLPGFEIPLAEIFTRAGQRRNA